MAQEKFALNVKHSVYVIANHTATIPEAGLTLTQLKALAAPALDADKKQDVFLMDGEQTMVLNDGIIANKEIPVTLRRAAAKIRITLNYVNGFTPLDGETPSKKIVNYAADGSSIAQGAVIPTQLQTMNSFTARTQVQDTRINSSYIHTLTTGRKIRTVKRMCLSMSL